MDRRFAWGVSLIVASVFLGVTYKFYILAKAVGTTSFDWLSIRSYLGDPVLEIATVIYILSWPMLFFGIYLCGKEGPVYAERFTKYVTYKYYHHQAKHYRERAVYYHRQARKHVPRITKQGVQETRRIVKRTGRMVERGRAKTRLFLEENLNLTRSPARSRRKQLRPSRR